MPGLFHSFIAELERIQGQPIKLSNGRGFTCLFEGDLAVESILSDDERSLVTDIWVGKTDDVPARQREFLLALLLEMNDYAALTKGAIFSLDEESRVVMSLTQPLASLTVSAYLAALHGLLDAARQVRQIMLTIHPVITIVGEADVPLPDEA